MMLVNIESLINKDLFSITESCSEVVQIGRFFFSVEMLSVYIPEEDRSIDVLELVEHPSLLE